MLDNGFVLEINANDASNADTIAEIRERATDASLDSQRIGTDNGNNGDNNNVVRVVENTSAGVKVTVTSQDADTAAKLVEIGTAMKEGKIMPMGPHWGHGGFPGAGPWLSADISQTVTLLGNGFAVDVSAKDTTDADAIAEIQSKAAEMEARMAGKLPAGFMGIDISSVTHTVENTSAGVKVTVTSQDADTAAKLVEIGTAMKDGNMPFGKGDKGGRGYGFHRGDMGFRDDATRTVTTLDNGYVLEISAKDTTDADAIARIQQREADAPRGPENSDVARVVENTSAGVKVTVTSSDADTAAKLVDQAERMQERETRRQEADPDGSGTTGSGTVSDRGEWPRGADRWNYRADMDSRADFRFGNNGRGAESDTGNDNGNRNAGNGNNGNGNGNNG